MWIRTYARVGVTWLVARVVPVRSARVWEARAWRRLAVVRSARRRDGASVRRAAESALGTARRAGDPRTMVECLGGVAFARHVVGAQDEASVAADELIRLVPDVDHPRPDTLSAVVDVLWVLEVLGRPGAIDSLTDLALAWVDRACPPGGVVPRVWRAPRAGLIVARAGRAELAGRCEDAIRFYREACTGYAMLMTWRRPLTIGRWGPPLARARANLARLLLNEADQPGEAIAALDPSSLTVLRFAHRHQPTLGAREYVSTQLTLAAAYAKLGDPTIGAVHARTALTAARAIVDDLRITGHVDHDLAVVAAACTNLAQCLKDAENAEDADPGGQAVLLDEAVTIRRFLAESGDLAGQRRLRDTLLERVTLWERTSEDRTDPGLVALTGDLAATATAIVTGTDTPDLVEVIQAGDFERVLSRRLWQASSVNDRPPGARAAAEAAVAHFRLAAQLATDVPEAGEDLSARIEGKLAEALELTAVLSDKDDPGIAGLVAEAWDLRRTHLDETNPATMAQVASTAELMATVRAEAGAHAEAVEPAVEAVRLYQSLITRHAGPDSDHPRRAEWLASMVEVASELADMSRRAPATEQTVRQRIQEVLGSAIAAVPDSREVTDQGDRYARALAIVLHERVRLRLTPTGTKDRIVVNRADLTWAATESRTAAALYRDHPPDRVSTVWLEITAWAVALSACLTGEEWQSATMTELRHYAELTSGLSTTGKTGKLVNQTTDWMLSFAEAQTPDIRSLWAAATDHPRAGEPPEPEP